MARSYTVLSVGAVLLMGGVWLCLLPRRSAFRSRDKRALDLREAGRESDAVVLERQTNAIRVAIVIAGRTLAALGAAAVIWALATSG